MIRKLAIPMLLICLGAALGCRSHQKTVAVAPQVAPPQAVKAKAPETRVETPKEFTPAKPQVDELGNDPTQATLLAEQRGWLRDAFFDFDSSTLTPAAQRDLTSSADWLRGHRKFGLLIEGHCDERGTERYNLALGDHRAWGAKEYLAALGIDPAAISTVSYGKERPFDTGHDEQAWARNRRDHLVLTAAK